MNKMTQEEMREKIKDYCRKTKCKECPYGKPPIGDYDEVNWCELEWKIIHGEEKNGKKSQ